MCTNCQEHQPVIFVIVRITHKVSGLLFVDSIYQLKASPWEHQAGLLHAIARISMKACQFQGSTPKLEKTNWFVFWIFRGGDRPPPIDLSHFHHRNCFKLGKIYEALNTCVFDLLLWECIHVLIHHKWRQRTGVSQFDWPLVNQPRQINEWVVRYFEKFKYLTISRSNIFRCQKASTIIFMSLCSPLFRLLITFLGTPMFLVQMPLITST